MSDYDVMTPENFTIEELTLAEQETIQGGALLKFLAGVFAAGYGVGTLIDKSTGASDAIAEGLYQVFG